VPVFGHWSWLNRFLSWEDFRRCSALSVLERDHQLKRAMGFPDEHFTRIHGLLRRSGAV